MSWNYRIVRHPGKFGSHYKLHEVYYDDNGKISGATQDAVSFDGEKPQEIIDSLHQALEDVLKTRVLDEDRLDESY